MNNAFKEAERAYLNPPDEPEPHHCECCGEIPDGGELYSYGGDWICSDCLLENFECRDAFRAEEWE